MKSEKHPTLTEDKNLLRPAAAKPSQGLQIKLSAKNKMTRVQRMNTNGLFFNQSERLFI